MKKSDTSFRFVAALTMTLCSSLLISCAPRVSSSPLQKPLGSRGLAFSTEVQEDDVLSANGARSQVVLTPTSGGSITDSSGSIWTLTSTGDVYKDGQPAAGGSGTSKLTYVVSTKKIWGQDATSGTWYYWNGTTWTGATSVSPVPLPDPVPSPSPTPVPTQIVLTPSSGGSISDAAGNIWTLTTAGDVYENGAPAAGGSGTAQLTYVASTKKIWGQDATSGTWYYWNGTTWTGATSVSPITSPSPSPSPSQSPSPSPSPAPAPAPNVVAVNFNNPTGQVIYGTEFGLSTNWGYSIFQNQSFLSVANQWPTHLLRWNWELHTLMDKVYPTRGSSADFSQIDPWLNNPSSAAPFFDNSTGKQVITMGFPSWLDYTNSSDQALFGRLALTIVQHFAQKGQPVRYIDIANEPDGLDANSLALLFNSMADAIHGYDSSIKCGGFADSWYQSGRMDTFFKVSGPRIGFVSFHRYSSCGTAESGVSPKAPQDLVNTGLALESDAKQVRKQMTQAGLSSSIEIFLGEWNTNGCDWTDPNNGNLLGAINAAATTYGMIASNSNMTMGALWETHDDSTYSTYGSSPNYGINPVGVTLSWLGQKMPGQRVQAIMPSNTPGLVGYASKGLSGRLSLALVNTNLTQAYHVDLSSDGFGTSVTRQEVSSLHPQGATTTVPAANLANQALPAGSVVIISK